MFILCTAFPSCTVKIFLQKRFILYPFHRFIANLQQILIKFFSISNNWVPHLPLSSFLSKIYSKFYYRYNNLPFIKVIQNSYLLLKRLTTK